MSKYLQKYTETKKKYIFLKGGLNPSEENFTTSKIISSSSSSSSSPPPLSDSTTISEDETSAMEKFLKNVHQLDILIKIEDCDYENNKETYINLFKELLNDYKDMEDNTVSKIVSYLVNISKKNYFQKCMDNNFVDNILQLINEIIIKYIKFRINNQINIRNLEFLLDSYVINLLDVTLCKEISNKVGNISQRNEFLTKIIENNFMFMGSTELYLAFSDYYINIFKRMGVNFNIPIRNKKIVDDFANTFSDAAEGSPENKQKWENLYNKNIVLFPTENELDKKLYFNSENEYNKGINTIISVINILINIDNNNIHIHKRWSQILYSHFGALQTGDIKITNRDYKIITNLLEILLCEKYLTQFNKEFHQNISKNMDKILKKFIEIIFYQSSLVNLFVHRTVSTKFTLFNPKIYKLFNIHFCTKIFKIIENSRKDMRLFYNAIVLIKILWEDDSEFCNTFEDIIVSTVEQLRAEDPNYIFAMKNDKINDVIAIALSKRLRQIDKCDVPHFTQVYDVYKKYEEKIKKINIFNKIELDADCLEALNMLNTVIFDIQKVSDIDIRNGNITSVWIAETWGAIECVYLSISPIMKLLNNKNYNTILGIVIRGLLILNQRYLMVREERYNSLYEILFTKYINIVEKYIENMTTTNNMIYNYFMESIVIPYPPVVHVYTNLVEIIRSRKYKNGFTDSLGNRFLYFIFSKKYYEFYDYFGDFVDNAIKNNINYWKELLFESEQDLDIVIKIFQRDNLDNVLTVGEALLLIPENSVEGIFSYLEFRGLLANNEDKINALESVMGNEVKFNKLVDYLFLTSGYIKYEPLIIVDEPSNRDLISKIATRLRINKENLYKNKLFKLVAI
jgi:hypothetical protein